LAGWVHEVPYATGARQGSRTQVAEKRLPRVSPGVGQGYTRKWQKEEENRSAVEKGG